MLCYAKAVAVHEEATCACLGAGVSSGLVVDIGATRTTVCCVDEGMSMPGCRHVLSYGGDDLDRLLLWLLRRQRVLLPGAPASFAPAP
jgi:actin-related protein 8